MKGNLKMKKIFDVTEKRSGKLLFSFTVYDKKIESLLLKQFRKMKQVNLIEVKDER